MRLPRCILLALLCWSGGPSGSAAEPTPLQPFAPDAHTLLLYHFDEGQGTVAKDASGRGCDGQVRGARWATGRFGKALLFDGKDDSVFCELTGAIRGLRQITVECWFRQENPEGRQFLVGKDVTFHFDLSGGAGTSMSLYHKGAREANAEGLRHQHLGTGLGAVRSGRWHHIAATYDGRHLSFFLDGLLKRRVAAARDFSLGIRSRGLWVGSHVGTYFWFSGSIDEVRVSDCVRYDSQKKLREGKAAFDMPRKARTRKTVRKPRVTGKATLRLGLKRLHGGSASGWVYLKPPGRRAAIVGRFAIKEAEGEAESTLELDVSDEAAGDGSYLVGLETTQGGGYFAVTEAALLAGGTTLATWTGEARSRRTFKPPVLVPLRVGRPTKRAEPGRILLLPTAIDRASGALEIDDEHDATTPCLFGEGLAEWWLDLPTGDPYRVYLRYASARPQPCDIVVDGEDLNDFDMCALNRTDSSHPRDALWEYQGAVWLAQGLHWIRIQDILPEIVGLRLEPVAAAPEPGGEIRPAAPAAGSGAPCRRSL